MPNMDRIKQYKNVHMIGIGGTSMSGIAEILVHFGINVTGSDGVESKTTKKLQKSGIKVFIGHNASNVQNPDVIVYSAAIKPDNVEMIEAKNKNIPTIERANFLGELTRCFNETITIAGTHGKSTTTSMVALCFLEALKDPSIQVGAEIKQIDGNYKVGNSEYFIIEACEYVESFLKFSPKTEIILNIDNDHLDYFKNFDNIKKAFEKYVKLLPNDGLLVLNGDDKNAIALSSYTDAKTITYGITNKNTDFFAVNIAFDNDGFPEFDVYANGNFYGRIKLSVAGMHNVLNALSCIAVCDYYGLEFKTIQSALSNFTGAGRRLEYKGMLNDAKIYDDYGHHPTEIVATSKALMHKQYNKSWIVFQPHTYSRTKNLLDDFAKALLNFDNIIILDIYAAREKNTYNISSKDLVDKIKSLGKNALYIPDFDECVKYIKDNIEKDDIVLTQGAGTVTQIGSMLLN